MDAVYWHDDTWSEENPKLIGPRDHAFWMSSVVFDGARAFDGMVPDVDQHCERLCASARKMQLAPTMSPQAITDLCIEAVRKFPKTAELYIRPMFYATEGFILPEPESTQFVLVVYQAPLPAFEGIGVCLSSRRRPARDMAPTDAKASCLYPNGGRALREANDRGFENCLIQDANGNIAELATANVWMVKDGKAYTPMWNGTFLNGVTRQRLAELLRADGIEVIEAGLTMEDFLEADEVFASGNYGKVTPITRVEERNLQRGPVTQRARELYWTYSAGHQIF